MHMTKSGNFVRYIRNECGKDVGFVHGRYLHAMRGHVVAVVEGPKVFDFDGHLIGLLSGDRVVDPSAPHLDFRMSLQPSNDGTPAA